VSGDRVGLATRASPPRQPGRCRWPDISLARGLHVSIFVALQANSGGWGLDRCRTGVREWSHGEPTRRDDERSGAVGPSVSGTPFETDESAFAEAGDSAFEAASAFEDVVLRTSDAEAGEGVRRLAGGAGPGRS